MHIVDQQHTQVDVTEAAAADLAADAVLVPHSEVLLFYQYNIPIPLCRVLLCCTTIGGDAAR